MYVLFLICLVHNSTTINELEVDQTSPFITITIQLFLRGEGQRLKSFLTCINVMFLLILCQNIKSACLSYS